MLMAGARIREEVNTHSVHVTFLASEDMCVMWRESVCVRVCVFLSVCECVLVDACSHAALTLVVTMQRQSISTHTHTQHTHTLTHSHTHPHTFLPRSHTHA